MVVVIKVLVLEVMVKSELLFIVFVLFFVWVLKFFESIIFLFLIILIVKFGILNVFSVLFVVCWNFFVDWLKRDEVEIRMIYKFVSRWEMENGCMD